MNSGQVRRWIGIVLLGFLIGLVFIKPVQQYFTIPNHLRLFQHEDKALFSSNPVFSHVSTVSSDTSVKPVQKGDQLLLAGKNTGNSEVTLTVGGFPIKKVNVDVLPDIRVIPGGQSIGVKLNTVGVLVVGYHLVHTERGEKSPGEKAGIKVGDIITKINDVDVQEMDDVAPLVKKAGKHHQSLDVTILRNKTKMHKTLEPQKDKEAGVYQIGLYIRDSAAGIGTLTFYDPKSMVYGALGHVISDMDTKEPIVVHDGKIVRSNVTSIEKGMNGRPGEKIAELSPDRSILGTVRTNSAFGIFGKLKHEPKNAITRKPIPIAMSGEVEEGPAKIYTVVNGDKVKAFDVKILSSVPQKFPATKGLVIKITDPELLKKTGGIVQGMSGSPIVQNGKLIGAVTHVFVNDPTTGYGVHIEWMMDEAGYHLFDKGQKAS
ncbi:MAG TPA: SpoIVB peptidase [Bacillales bacterium]|nr:SpoIVB peptidase [Bacillales bacterium]